MVAALVMTLTGFLLSAVGGYLVGLVGSSNQPVSGLTLAALVIAALVMVALGVKGMAGVGAVLGVAAVVCCACCVSGSLIQDLKAGHLLGGTPWKMELVEIMTVIVLAFFLIWPITVLHEAYGIGSRALPAPQAGLMAQLAKGIVSGQMAWGLIAVGAAFGVALIFSGARSPMLIAVGMYLPFETVSAIFVGGVLRWFADRIAARRSPEGRAQVEEKGTLLASGLIAGEAIIGILLAVLAVREVPSLTRFLTGCRRVRVLRELGRMAEPGGLRRAGLRAGGDSQCRAETRRRRIARRLRFETYGFLYAASPRPGLILTSEAVSSERCLPSWRVVVLNGTFTPLESR